MGVEVVSCVELSDVAVSDTHGENSPYFAGWKAYEEDPYDAVENPEGIIQMGLAENQVSFDLLENYLRKHPEVSTWGEDFSDFREMALFQDYHGLRSFKKALASFMEKIRGGRVKFDPERIVLTAGATAAVELLAFVLVNPGEGILVPTPYYPGFDRDLRWRTRIKIVPIHCESKTGFQITAQALNNAYKEAEAKSIKVRGVLLTNPSNPLGVTVDRSALDLTLDFAERKNIHVMSDEIYSGSVFTPDDFVSVAEIVKTKKEIDPRRVHIIYSLSKDLGLPGFRVGAIYSYNNKVVTTATRMSSFTLVSSQTQHMLSQLLSDVDFVDKYIWANRKRLKNRYDYIVGELKRCGIRCLDGNAGLFCWVDFGPLMGNRTVEGEIEIWKALVHDVKINVSPGSSCHCSEPGWFRVCFANMNLETVDVALERIRCFLIRKVMLD